MYITVRVRKPAFNPYSIAIAVVTLILTVQYFHSTKLGEAGEKENLPSCFSKSNSYLNTVDIPSTYANLQDTTVHVHE